MSRNQRLAILAVIVMGAMALAGFLIWWAGGHRSTSQLAAGLVLVAAGIGLTILHFTASEAFLQRHFGGAASFRRESRRGWIGILLGGALIGLYFIDREADATIKDSQYRAALDRGRIDSTAGDWTAAADAFTKAIQLDSNNPRAYAERGLAYIRLGDLDRALADLNEAIRLDPTHARVIYNRGIVRIRKGEWDLAIADLSEAIRLDPQYARAYLARSRAYRAQGDDAKANEDRQRAIELDPALDKAKDVNLV
ncbi:MAG TPA: tetratricopeptide repeat protein [Gemmataceae bacterium]|jgi:tetratricopeptide (TPR) repeat protein|nr:tetratricopeptide repeat protein [Gemmataceae bacterium]